MSTDLFSVPLKDLKHELVDLCQPPLSEIVASKWASTLNVAGVKRRVTFVYMRNLQIPFLQITA